MSGKDPSRDKRNKSKDKRKGNTKSFSKDVHEDQSFEEMLITYELEKKKQKEIDECIEEDNSDSDEEIQQICRQKSKKVFESNVKPEKNSSSDTSCDYYEEI